MVWMLVIPRGVRHHIRSKISEHSFDLSGEIVAGKGGVRNDDFRWRGTVFPGKRTPTEWGQPLLAHCVEQF